MRNARFLLALGLFAAACSPAPRRRFPVGFLEPVSPRAAAEARRMGLETAADAPAGAATVPTIQTDESATSESSLRFAAARAIAEGAGGIYFRLPATPTGRDLLDYVEEWRAVSRVAQELVSLRPIFESGEPASGVFEPAAGLESRAWTYEGRRYAVLVNSSSGNVPLEESRLEPFRALFAVRADPRQLLAPCGKAFCLRPGDALWLEGRPSAP